MFRFFYWEILILKIYFFAVTCWMQDTGIISEGMEWWFICLVDSSSCSWIMTSLSKDQRSKEAQVSLRLNGSAFVDEFNCAFIYCHNCWAEDRTVLTRFHCSCVKIQRQELVKFHWLTFVTIVSSFYSVRNPSMNQMT